MHWMVAQLAPVIDGSLVPKPRRLLSAGHIVLRHITTLIMRIFLLFSDQQRIASLHQYIPITVYI